MLCDPPVLGLDNISLPQSVQQSGFAMINVTDNGHNWRPCHKIFDVRWIMPYVKIFFFNSRLRSFRWNEFEFAL